jgi:transposase
VGKRHDLSDREWELIRALLPRPKKIGRPPREFRQVLDGVFWILRTGAPWRDLPERYGPWQTVYDRFSRWRRDGTWNGILERLQIRLDREGKIDWDLWCVDGSSIRAQRSAAGARKGGITQESQRTMHWVAQEAAGEPRSTWYVTVGAPPSR